MKDQLGRPLRALRLSVTDRCNFRCTYCMPRAVFGKDYPFLPREEILTFDELERLARVFTGLGVEKVRLTGGEPLLRHGLEELVERLARLPGMHDMALTTNGSLLAEKAAALRAAGLQRLTVSVDSLVPETFAAMSDTGVPLGQVLHGIEVAAAAGFAPIRINMVVRRGVNEHEVPEMTRRFGGAGFILRFIEYMDVGNSNGWRREEVVPAAEILARLSDEHALTRLPANYAGEVAQRFRTASGGEIGLVASVTEPFCAGCTRARLSADGRLFTCLFAGTGTDLRGPLRAGASEAGLSALIAGVWGRREDRYSELRGKMPPHPRAEMSLLGG